MDRVLCINCESAQATVSCTHDGRSLPFCSKECSDKLCHVLRVGPRFDDKEVDDLADLLQEFTFGRQIPWGVDTWNRLPVELKLFILNKLPFLTLLGVASIDKGATALLKDDKFWRSQYDHFAPLLHAPARTSSEDPHGKGWKWVLLQYFLQYDFVLHKKGSGEGLKLVSIRLQTADNHGNIVWIVQESDTRMVIRNAKLLRGGGGAILERILLGDVKFRGCPPGDSPWEAEPDQSANSDTIVLRPDRSQRNYTVGSWIRLNDISPNRLDIESYGGGLSLFPTYLRVGVPVGRFFLPNSIRVWAGPKRGYDARLFELEVIGFDTTDPSPNSLTVKISDAVPNSGIVAMPQRDATVYPGAISLIGAVEHNSLDKWPSMPRVEWVDNATIAEKMKTSGFAALAQQEHRQEANRLDEYLSKHERSPHRHYQRLGVKLYPGAKPFTGPRRNDYLNKLEASALFRMILSVPYLAPSTENTVRVVYYAKLDTKNTVIDLVPPINDNISGRPVAVDFSVSLTPRDNGIDGFNIGKGKPWFELDIDANLSDKLRALAIRTDPSIDASYTVKAYVVFDKFKARLGRCIPREDPQQTWYFLGLQELTFASSDLVNETYTIPTEIGGPDGIAKRMV